MESKFNHKEAFCMMSYKCENCGHNERIWNSRDGVTPFIIGCPKCNDEMMHVDWENDQYLPDHTPSRGDRIFIDLPKQIGDIYCKMRIERFWENQDYPMKDKFNSKQEAFDKMSPGFNREGEPFIITI